jgi:hypothetical protein
MPLKESCVVFIIQKHNIVVFSFNATTRNVLTNDLSMKTVGALVINL